MGNIVDCGDYIVNLNYLVSAKRSGTWIMLSMSTGEQFKVPGMYWHKIAGRSSISGR